uniref:Death domain-containing protein n=1 Tax=Amphimedon queenslandica TaxID=400682 RepID=A0A1X7U9I0_AMPQE
MAATPGNGSELTIQDLALVETVLGEAMFGPVSWQKLGLDLGIYITNLNVIEREKGDSTEHLRKTLQQWLNKVDKVRDTRWPTLIKAVRSTGDNAAADRMPNIIKKHSNV